MSLAPLACQCHCRIERILLIDEQTRLIAPGTLPEALQRGNQTWCDRCIAITHLGIAKESEQAHGRMLLNDSLKCRSNRCLSISLSHPGSRFFALPM
jgi:hypothetical protein